MLRILLSIVMVTISVVAPSQAATPSGPSVKYVYLQPDFIVNYDHTGRMKYLKTEVALKVSTDEAAAKIALHKAYLRNEIILLLSSQDSNVVNTAEGRENLRKQALDKVRSTLVKLEGSPYIDDLYFSNFVVQS